MKNKSESLLVRQGNKLEWNESMTLAWTTFMEYNSKDYSDRGIKSFYEFITNDNMFEMFITNNYIMFVAIKDELIVGVITLRNQNHVSLLFVKKGYHRQGIGQELVEELKKYINKNCLKKTMTVNASPYAIKFYHDIGFFDKGIEQENDGIKYVPMEKYI